MLPVKIEIYNSPEGQVCIKPFNGAMYVLDEKQREFTQSILWGIQDLFPEAFQKLSELYSISTLNKAYFEFRIVHRFCRCNFGKYDTQEWDIDEFGEWHLEQVECPLRGGYCPHEGIICCPKMRIDLTEREIEIAKLLGHLSPEEITNELNVSIRTVYNHIRSIKLRLKIKTTGQIAAWYKTNIRQ